MGGEDMEMDWRWEIQQPKPDICSSRDVTHAGRRTQVMIGTRGRFSCSVGAVHLWMSNVPHFLMSII